QAVVVFGIGVQVEVQAARLFLSHHLLRHGPHFRFYAPSAHCAYHGPIVADQNLRALVTWNRALHLDNGGQRRFAPFLPELRNFGEDIHSPSSARLITGCSDVNDGPANPSAGSTAVARRLLSIV